MNIDFSIASRTTVGKRMIKDVDGHEPETVELLRSLILSKDGKRLFINVGSHIGFYPLLVSELKNIHGVDIDVYGHEPYDEIRKIAIALMEHNNLNYNIKSEAISDSIGEVDFYISTKSDSSCSIIEGFRKYNEIRKLKMDTLDNIYYDIISENSYSDIIFLIDAEMAELKVLSGAANILRDFKPTIICEVLSNPSIPLLENMLRSAKYNFYSYKNNEWIKSDHISGDPTYKYNNWLFQI